MQKTTIGDALYSQQWSVHRDTSQHRAHCVKQSLTRTPDTGQFHHVCMHPRHPVCTPLSGTQRTFTSSANHQHPNRLFPPTNRCSQTYAWTPFPTQMATHPTSALHHHQHLTAWYYINMPQHCMPSTCTRKPPTNHSALHALTASHLICHLFGQQK